MTSYLDTISRRLEIAVECGASEVSLKANVISGRWCSTPKVVTPTSPRSVVEDLLNSTESVSVHAFGKVATDFTRRYGALALPYRPNEKFSFSLSDWIRDQKQMESVWHILSGQSHAPSARTRVFMSEGERFEITAGHLSFRTVYLQTYAYLAMAAVPKRRLCVCANRLAGCKTPFFIAKDLRSKYCSDICAAEGEKASKLRWWNDNRKEQ